MPVINTRTTETTAPINIGVMLSDTQVELIQPDSSDVNLERTEMLKLAIHNGELKMDTNKIADVLVNEAQQDSQSN